MSLKPEIASEINTNDKSPEAINRNSTESAICNPDSPISQDQKVKLEVNQNLNKEVKSTEQIKTQVKVESHLDDDVDFATAFEQEYALQTSGEKIITHASLANKETSHSLESFAFASYDDASFQGVDYADTAYSEYAVENVQKRDFANGEMIEDVYHQSAFLIEEAKRLADCNYLAEKANQFDFSVLKPDHVHGSRYYQGKEQVNFAETPLLDKDNPTSSFAKAYMEKRFRGFYPVVIDIETTGLDFNKHGIFQIGAVALTVNDQGELVPYAKLRINILPENDIEYMGRSLMITGINPFDHSRKAVSKETALKALCKFARQAQKAHGCKRSVMVAHNAAFDAGFIHHHIEQCKIKRNPFHPFTNFDTSVLGAVFLGDNRLKEALANMNVQIDDEQAHDALYDAELCGELFCYCVNKLKFAIGEF